MQYSNTVLAIICFIFNIYLSYCTEDLDYVDDVPPWGYGSTNDQVYGVNDWKNISKTCNGRRQSPINIPHKYVRHKRYRTKIQLHYTLDSGLVYGVLKNNGHSPVFTVNVSRASVQMTEVPHHRKDLYILKKIYFRFGCTEKTGSEHQIDNVPTPGEIHLVFYKDDYRTLGRAINKKDGLVIMAVLLGGDANYNRGLTDLTTYLPQITQPGDEVNLKDGLRLTYLLPQLRHLKYYTYKGSIPTPPCYESVRWFVLKSPIAITTQQLDELRKLQGGNGRMCDNSRDIQPLHGRRVSLYL